MSQPIVINIGAIPNDGTGDPLRTAFNDVNLNFANVFTAGPVGSNIQIANNTILTTNTNGNLILNPNGIGVVQANAHVVPDQNRIRNLGSANQLWDTTYTQYLQTTYATIGTASIGNIGTFNIDVGNLHISGGTNGYVLQTDGTGNLTWTAQTGGTGNGTPGGANTQIQYNDGGAFGGTAGFIFDNTSNVLSVPGNVSAGNVLTSDQVIANGEIQSGTGFFTGGYLSVNGDTDLANVDVSGNLSAVGDISANAFVGDGSQLTNLPLATVSTVGAVALGNGFTLNASNQVTTSSLYNTNLTQPTQHYALRVDTNGVVILPDQSIINGSTLRAVAGSYAGLTTDDGENSWMWVDSSGAYIATQYNESGNSHQWTFDNTGNLTLPGNGEISINYANGQPYGGTGSGGAAGNAGDIQINVAGNIGADSTLRYVDDGGEMTLFADYMNSPGGLFTNDIMSYPPGNIHITSDTGNTTSWTFGADGNLTLPSNTSSINYANGDPYGGSGGANTGNVTFSDQIVIGTGISNLVSGLYLAPSSSSANAVQYLRVRGDVTYEPTHIHFDTGNNQYFNQFIGDDNKYVLLSNTGNIVINTDDYAGNSAQWTFGVDGNLTVPGNILGSGNILIAPDSANSGGYLDIYLTTGPDVHIASNGDSNLILGRDDSSNVTVNTDGNVTIQANTSTPHVWKFDSSGNLNVPQGGYIGAAGVKGDGTMLTGGAGNIASVTSFYANGFYAGCFTANPDGNVNITTYTGNGIAGQWAFDTAGNLTVPGNIIMTTGIVGSGASPAPYLSGFDSVSAVTLSASGNVTGDYIIGNGSQLTNLPAPTVTYDNTSTGYMDIMTYDGNIKYISTATIEPASGNIKTVGDISATGNVYATNIVAEAPFSIQTANFNAVIGGRYGVNTTGGAVTATLPVAPATGGAVFFADAGGAYSSNNLIINPNGGTIMGASGNMTVSTDNQSVGLFYNGATWRIYNAG